MGYTLEEYGFTGKDLLGAGVLVDFGNFRSWDV